MSWSYIRWLHGSHTGVDIKGKIKIIHKTCCYDMLQFSYESFLLGFNKNTLNDIFRDLE